MLTDHLRRLNTHWPMLFTIGVAIYFVIAAIDLPDRLPFADGPTDGGDATAPLAAASEPTTSTVTVSNLDIAVTAFRIQPDSKHPGRAKASLTLDVKNTGKANTEFRADQLLIRRVGSSQTIAPEAGAPKASVSPHLGVIVPVSFLVEPSTGSSYELLYQGRRIFSGLPR